jgi:hypothetical protein
MGHLETRSRLCGSLSTPLCQVLVVESLRFLAQGILVGMGRVMLPETEIVRMEQG